MITIIETNDGRLLITDKEDIESVLLKAKADLIELDSTEDVLETMNQFKGKSYVLIEQSGFRIDTDN